jgi:putative aldouronate transport system substrate-binding protein
MKKTVRILLAAAFCLAFLMPAVACQSASPAISPSTAAQTAQTVAPTSSSTPDPFGKMPETVEFSIGMSLPSDPKLPEGESMENNDIVKHVEAALNVKMNVAWTTSDQGAAYEDKINLCIASSNIPDVLTLGNMTILRKLVTNDMIGDLTRTYEDFASPSFKQHHADAGNVAIKGVTLNGKLMAIPTLTSIDNVIQIEWIRQDWLDKLKLQAPKTLDDMAGIAKAFIEQDPDGNGKADTLGILGCSTLYAGDTNTFDLVFNAFNSYPGDWIRGKDGSVVYGSIQPETKLALQKLRDWYAAGLLDQEFALKDALASTEPVVGGKAGLMQGAWWSPWWPLNNQIQNDPSAEWFAYGIASDDGNYYAHGASPAASFTVVRNGFKYPEVVMKLINISQDCLSNNADWYNELTGIGGKYANTTATLLPIYCSAKYTDEITRRWKVIKDALDGVTAPDSLDNTAKNAYDQIKINRESPKKDISAWANDVAWTRGANVFIEDKFQQNIPAFYGATDTMVKKMTPMNDLEKDTFIRIIMGKLAIDEFDSFVAQWKSMGGDEITAEVNAAVK